MPHQSRRAAFSPQQRSKTPRHRALLRTKAALRPPLKALDSTGGEFDTLRLGWVSGRFLQRDSPSLPPWRPGAQPFPVKRLPAGTRRFRSRQFEPECTFTFPVGRDTSESMVELQIGCGADALAEK